MLSLADSLLTVDLSNRVARQTDIAAITDTFLGGRGVGTRLAYDHIPFDADPLGPGNRLVFATGPLQTSNVSFTGRTSCTGLSPLTGGLLSSNAGGFLSRNLADTGYAAIELTGASDELLAVHVRDDGVEFEPVPELADARVSAVGDAMNERHGLGPDQLAVTGPAGEHGVRFAAIMTTDSRAFGRGGLGAVLGAKGVKCLSFAGDSRPTVEIPDVGAAIHREAATSDSPMRESGTTSITEFANEVDALPTRYFSEQSFDGAAAIGGEAVGEKKYQKGTCSACAFACKLPTRDEASGLETEGPEFETVMAFGSNCGVDDVVSVMKSNDLCDDLGLDTISCGDVVAAYLASEDAFGDSERIHSLVEQIAYRDGIGDLLAEGIDRIHDELGVENWTVKGMEFPGHDGRTLHGQGLAFATANRGADHMYAEFYDYEYPLVDRDEAFPQTGLTDKPPALVAAENRNAVEDSAIICAFSSDIVPDPRLGTLLDADIETLLDIGDRIVTLERHFNNQRGFDRSNDTLPFDLPGFEAALDEYYLERGWDTDGTVPARLAEAALATE